MREFKINDGLTLADYEKNIEKYIKKPTNFGQKGGKCMKFVRLLIESLGFQMFPTNPDAWEMFAGLLGTKNIGLKLIGKKWDKPLDNADLQKIGVNNGSIVFGYYTTSTHFVDGLNANKKATNAKAVRLKLKEYRFDSIPNKSVGENVCTHVGYYLNGQLYHVIYNSGVSTGPTHSFRAVGWLPFDKIVRKKLETLSTTTVSNTPKKITNAAAQLWAAIDGVGTDEDLIKDTVNPLSKSERISLEKYFNSQNKVKGNIWEIKELNGDEIKASGETLKQFFVDDGELTLFTTLFRS